MNTKIDFKPGDVVRYEPPNGWCREGMAITREDGVLVDTYWMSDNHVLTEDEIATAQLVFNLLDFHELDRYRHDTPEKWQQFNPADRETVTSQHGLQVRWFVRKGAQPDLATQVENARQVLADAEERFTSAGRQVENARRELERIEAST